MKKIAFMVPPFVEILDLAGPMQVFTEARYYGFETELEFYCLEEDSVSSSGLPFGKVSFLSHQNQVKNSLTAAAIFTCLQRYCKGRRK